MASFCSSLSRFGHYGAAITRRRIISNSKAFDLVSQRHSQGGPHSPQEAANATKQGVNEALAYGDSVKTRVSSTAENKADKAKETTDNVAEKAKQIAKEAWESAKETAQKTKDNVMNKADQASQAAKDTTDRNL